MQSVLFVSLGFYNYDDKIKQEIEELGYEVTQFTPIGKYTTIQKLFNAATKGKYLKNKCRKRQLKYMNNANKQYDYVFVIVGRHLDPDILAQFKESQKNAKFILYLWDDIARVEHYEDNKQYYDEIYSFDLKDVREYGVKHLPLFYTDAHVYHGEDKKYLLNMSGTLHSARVAVWDKILTRYKLDESKCFLFLLGTQMKHFFQSILPSKDRWMSPKYIHVNGMKFEDMAKIFKQSKIAVDVQFGSQAGLTMRTLESIGSEVKLITTNPYVKEYDFYEYGNICVIDKDDPQIPSDFFTSAYNPIPQELVDQYSLTNWVRTMLGQSK